MIPLEARIARAIHEMQKRHGVHDVPLAVKCAEVAMREAGLVDGVYVRLPIANPEIVAGIAGVIKRVIEGGEGWTLLAVSPGDLNATSTEKVTLHG